MTTARARVTDSDGIEYRAFPEHGAYFGVTTFNGRPCLLVVPMLESGAPDLVDGDELNAVEVSNIEDDDTCLDTINAEFGTTFTPADFFGR